MLPTPEDPAQEAPASTPSGASPYVFGAILAVNVAALGYLTWELHNYTEAKNSATVALSLKADHDRAIEMLSADEAKLRLKVEDLSTKSSAMSMTRTISGWPPCIALKDSSSTKSSSWRSPASPRAAPLLTTSTVSSMSPSPAPRN